MAWAVVYYLGLGRGNAYKVGYNSGSFTPFLCPAATFLY